MDQKLTALHSVPTWLPQTETWLYNQIRSLPSTVESHIVCKATENLDQFFLPNIHPLREERAWRNVWDKTLRKLGTRHHLGFLVKLAKRYHAQVLHSHFGNTGWANIGAAKPAGMKHVVSFYGFDVNYLPNVDSRWHTRYQELFGQADCILAEGPHMAQRLVALGCPSQKVQIHHLGVGVDWIAFKPRSWNPGKSLRILIAASFQEKKGIPYALEALGELQHKIPLEITVIGDANSEPRSHAEKERILATIHKHNLQARVRMLGFQPHANLLDEAYKHHIFLSPSLTATDGDTEGGAPVSIIEMAASGMLVVSTTHCDIPEVITHGVTGLLAGERDVKALAQHLQWLINHPHVWEEILREGRKRVEAEFNVKVQGRRLASLYAKLTKAQRNFEDK